MVAYSLTEINSTYKYIPQKCSIIQANIENKSNLKEYKAYSIYQSLFDLLNEILREIVTHIRIISESCPIFGLKMQINAQIDSFLFIPQKKQAKNKNRNVVVISLVLILRQKTHEVKIIKRKTHAVLH